MDQLERNGWLRGERLRLLFNPETFAHPCCSESARLRSFLFRHSHGGTGCRSIPDPCLSSRGFNFELFQRVLFTMRFTSGCEGHLETA